LKGVCILSQLDVLIYGERQSGGFAGDIACDHDGSAELAESARKRQDHACDQAAGGERQSDRQKYAKRGCSQGARDLFEAGIEFLKCHAGRAHE